MAVKVKVSQRLCTIAMPRRILPSLDVVVALPAQVVSRSSRVKFREMILFGEWKETYAKEKSLHTFQDMDWIELEFDIRVKRKLPKNIQRKKGSTRVLHIESDHCEIFV